MRITRGFGQEGRYAEDQDATGSIFGKNTVYSIPEILFWKIRNEFLIYHTWNNGISEKSEKSAMCNVPKPHQPPHAASFGISMFAYQKEKHNWLNFQNVNWFIRNTDFPENSFWNIRDVYRPKTPPTTSRSLFWHINYAVPKWKILTTSSFSTAHSWLGIFYVQ